MVNLFKKKIRKKLAFSAIFLLMFLFFNIHYVKADNIVTDLLGGTAGIASAGLFLILGALIQGVAWFIGQLLTVITDILFSVAGYSKFIDNNVVSVGWPIVRDLCNMFFILILLIIAFATILRVESYSWKKNLPKLLIMAVLINFSKTICGLAIDFAQVIMLTFVNGFAGSGAGNLYDALGLGKIFEISKLPAQFSDKNISGMSVFGSLLLGLFILIIAGVVIVIFTVILAFRIVMLWILIILSPLAFLAMAIPAGTKYASQWFGEFTKNIIVGPVLAFFLWLSLATVGQLDYATFGGYNSSTDSANQQTVSAALTTAGSKDNLTKFIVSICMLIGGLMMAQQIGAAGSSLAGGAVSKIKGAGAFLGGAPLALGKFGFLKTGRMVDNFQMKGQGLIAKGVAKMTKGYFGEKYQAKSLNYRMIKEGWDKNQASKMRDYEGTKAGAWQDQFNRTLSASIGVPIVSQIKRKNAEKQIKNNEGKMAKIQNIINQDKEKLKIEGTSEENKIKINAKIKLNEDEITKFKKENRNLANVTATWGKLPIQKYARLEEQQKANEEYVNIKKEDLNEEGLVNNYSTEGRIDKKRGYLMHLADTNGINSLFDARGEDMTVKNIQKLFAEFGDAAGDVAAEVSRRAEAAGNYKLMGFHRFDVAQGRNRVATKEEQFEYAMRKDNERYAQNHGRTTHFDSLVDRHANGIVLLSDIGTEQLLHIAANKGRMDEIGKGNYQVRYGEMVVNLKQQIINKAKEFNEKGEFAKASNLLKVLEEFENNYGLVGEQKKNESKKTTVSAENDKKIDSDDD